MPKSQPNLKVTANDSTAEVLIYDVIGSDFFGEGITGKRFAEELKRLGPGITEITVRINSPGGYMSDGLAIYNTLKTSKAKIITQVDGVALSAASLIAMAGDVIRMADNALMMIHNPWGGAFGQADDLRHEAEVLDKHRDVLIDTYVDRTRQERDQVGIWMNEETWFTAAEAVEKGFATERSANKAVAAYLDPQRFRNAPDALKDLLLPTPNQGAPPVPTDTKANDKPADAITTDQLNAAKEESAAAEHKRITEITALVNTAKLPAADKPALTKRLIEDRKVSVDDARKQLFDAMCASNAPVGDDGAGDTNAKPDPDAEFKKEYAAQPDVFKKFGVTEEQYIKSRRRDAA